MSVASCEMSRFRLIRASKVLLSLLTMCRRMSDGIGFLMSDVARLLRKRFDERARAIGVTRAQWRVGRSCCTRVNDRLGGFVGGGRADGSSSGRAASTTHASAKS